MKCRMSCLLLTCLLSAGAVFGQEAASPLGNDSNGIDIAKVEIVGQIEGQELTLGLSFEAVTKGGEHRLLLMQGDAVLQKLNQAKHDYKLAYDEARKAYYAVWARAGRHQVNATFVAKPGVDPNSPWREARLEVPAGRMRSIVLEKVRAELEVDLPGAMRVRRQIQDGHVRIEGIIGPGQPLVVRWKPQVKLADAKLVLSSQANTIVDVRAGLVRLDGLFDFQISQGQIESLSFAVPAGLRITALEGANIRNWTITDANEGVRSLVVELSRPQEKDYRLRIRGEAGVEKLPCEVEAPVIEPTGGIRAGGHLAVGTDSALQLLVLKSTGLTQIDATVFPRVQAGPSQDRPIPSGKAFFYTYSGSRYALRLAVDDIVPSYDVAGRLVATIKEDDLVVDAELELDVRDAPISELEIIVPGDMVVASVDGNQVEDYQVSKGPQGSEGTTVRTIFAKPVIGRALLGMRLELGRGPLGERQRIPALQVKGAKTHRGYVVVAAEAGIEVDDPEVTNLREVHTASVPLRVALAQFAYRFREPDWTLNVMARGKPAEIKAEVFHLESVGEALSYGSAVVNYIITGSPVDELRFSLPDGLENVEFVGNDVRRWTRQNDLWVVKLTRKVIGDYNLAVTYTQAYGPGRPIRLGALQCRDAQTQTGYVVVTSHLDLKLEMQPVDNAAGEGLMAITMDELPGDYRLLTSSPILAAYKYVSDPHVALLSIDPYRRSGLLPVVLDISAHQTRLAVRPDGQIESVTTVRYKVKNATGQFLSLAMPLGASVWTVSLIEQTGGGEQQTRLAASHDAESGRLLIPLSRKANPNDPATIEVEYGQVHGGDGWWRRHLELTAPRCAVPVSYAEWSIIAPNEWAIEASGGNMQAQPRETAQVGLGQVVKGVVRLWSRSPERWAGQPAVWVMGVAALILVVLCAIFFRRRLADLVAAILLIVLIWAGFGAAMCGDIEAPAPATSLSYAQAVNADPNAALEVRAELIPAWRQNIAPADMIVVGAILVAALVVTVARRRLWWPAAAAALAAGLYLAGKMPTTWPALEAAMTWGGPAVFGGWCVCLALSKRRHRVGAAAQSITAAVILMAAALSVLGGCANVSPGVKPLSEGSMIESIECNLSAGADNMEVRYNLRISAGGPAKFPLLSESAVLVSDPEPASHVKVRIENGRHTVVVDRADIYDVNATFLVPLAAAGPDHQRQFELPLPIALTNSVSLVIPDANIVVEAPCAVHLVCEARGGETVVETMFAPGDSAVFTWRPKERQASQEEVRFYAQDVALARVGSGLLEVFHCVRLQIAQGQVESLKLGIAAGETVTSVTAPNIGSWRFDPARQELEVRLTDAVTGIYEIMLVTQSASASVPYSVRLAPLVVQGALNQHSVMGLAADSAVYVRLDEHTSSMNVGDYIRDSSDLIGRVPGLSAEQITQAFRFTSPASAVTGQVLAVDSELRSQETARFNAEDDRLVYNSQWIIEISKAGRFDVVLEIPEGFDIDTLTSEQVSHWDESVEGGKREVRVHFKHKLTGLVQLNLSLSQPVAQMPERLTVPRVIVKGVLKHTGYLVVGSEQGVRLSVASRAGVSEVNPSELGQPGQGLLAFRLLRPDWQLELQTEVIQPRVTVQSLHAAKVTDGLVRHDHYLRYRLFHAGIKTFDLVLPAEATGVTITGAGIARREQLSGGNWRVELEDKVYDQPYLLRVSYETQFNLTEGKAPLAAVRCGGVDLQQGHIVVFATDRVELSIDSAGTSLRPAEARSIPKYFGAGDLSGAAMCYRSLSADDVLTVQARRHAAAAQIGAEVRRTDIATVVTPSGQTINRVTLLLRVGMRRHLQAILPEKGAIWSLSVDGQAVQPSIRSNAQGQDVLLVPLPQQTAADVLVEMVYVGQLPSVRAGGSLKDWAGPHQLSGPRFDLPLKQISWYVYVPEGFSYDKFGGTLTIDRKAVIEQQVHRYNLRSYERQIEELNTANDQFAQQQQELARELSQQGRQTDARRALSIGYNFSRGNKALNEDIRVDLDNLLKQQAKVGLVNARGRLRERISGTVDETGGLISVEGQSMSFSQQQAERIETSLGQADSENLELITQRIIQAQEAAEGSVAQLEIAMPFSGKMLRFDSPLQVEPEAAMAVMFRARERRMGRFDPGILYGVGILAGLLVLGGGVGCARRRWVRLQEILAPAPRSKQPTDPAEVKDSDESDGQVSADELI